MRALIVAVGTRGDVQPALALALELGKLGHAARLCVSPNFVDWIKSRGLEAIPMGVEMRMPQQKGSMLNLTPEVLRRLRESTPDLITDQFETIGGAVHGCDVIVGANAHQYAAPSIAERAGIGHFTAVYAPVAVPSPKLAPPAAPGQTEDIARAMSIEERWREAARVWNERALERINHNRGRLGLNPIGDVLEYVLTDHTWLAADLALAPPVPTPGRTMFQTGAWVPSDTTPLPADLEAFLDRGEPPVFVGFGSMPAPREASLKIIAAIRSVGRRIVLSRGWADLGLIDALPDCIAVGDVSHDVLFPRVGAIVHHGGAGTTAAAARAGVPQVITPMFSDQFYWASRVVDLGIGAATPFTALKEGLLSEVLHEALGSSVAVRALALAKKVGRNGAEIAARRLEDEYGRRPRSRDRP